MADLPPIPDEACRAVYAANISTDYGMVGSDEARTIIAAAWPHLYAAALRHAADEVMSTPGPGDVAVVNGSYSRGRLAAVAELRRLADTAAP